MAGLVTGLLVARAEARPGQLALSVSPTFATIVLGSQGEPSGGGASLRAHIALSSLFSVVGRAGWTAHEVDATDDAAGGTLQVLHGSVGLGYQVDLMRFAPKLDFTVGVLHRILAGVATTDLTISVEAGIDYPLKPWMLLGGGIALHAYVTAPTDWPIYLTLGPRITLRTL